MHDSIEEKLFMENWMSVLTPSLSKTRLNEITLPGSHDANTFSISQKLFGSGLCRCQSIPIYEQAMLGIRFFDFRYGSDFIGRRIVDKHGPLNGGDFMKNFEDLRDFSNQHPNEFFIISIQSEGKINKFQKAYLIKNIPIIFDGKLIDKEDMTSWFDLKKTTFGQVLKTPKRIFLIAREELWHGSDFSEEVLHAIGINNCKKYIMSRFHNVINEEVLIQKNLENLLLKKSNSEKMFCSQFVLTAQKNLKLMIKNLVMMDIPSIKKFVNKLNKGNFLMNFVSKNLSMGFNIMLFDHVESISDLLKMTVSWNNLDRLRVHKIYYGGEDFTRELIGHLHYDRFFYISNMQKLAREYQPKFNQICVVYSINNSNYRVFVSKLNADHVLLNCNPIRQKKMQISGHHVVVFVTEFFFKLETFSFLPSKEELEDLCLIHHSKEAIGVWKRDLLFFRM